jgi:Cu(I)/Ag(I) efflux system membrane fusion protein/cobalt-zinc-cadmium efflux system membrane fusion protein
MMKIKYIFKIIVFISVLIIGLLVTGCSTSDSSKQDTKTESISEELYTCGMHPNVIQEGKGNCPICGMNLTPLNGSSDANDPKTVGDKSSSGSKEILYYRAPMDPTYISPKPGKSPMGMDLVPVYAGEETFGATVKINPSTVQNIGVRTAYVVQRDLNQDIRTIGRIDYDEAKTTHVHTKFTGWVEQTYVNTTGQKVKKGDTLLEIYSPQLVTAQEEYVDLYLRLLEAKKENRTSAIDNLKSMLSSTRKRLENFDISRDQIDRLEKDQTIRKTLKIRSPFSGIVEKKHVQDGMEVKPGMNLYSISNISSVWVYADIYEYEVPWIKEGQDAKMTLSYIPGKEFSGKVEYVYPYLDSRTRTLKVRLSFPNEDNMLKPGMYANMNISSVPIKDAIAVPVEAVMYSGARNLVFIALDEGEFVPRDVIVGIESGDGFYEIKEGLEAGETVVTSAQFLLDSESKLQESISKMLASRKTTKSEAIENPINSEYIQEDPIENIDSKMQKDEMMEHDSNAHNMLKTEMDNTGNNTFGTIKNNTLSYYTCLMESHAYVKVNEAGLCPDCGMKLIQKDEPYNPDQKYYTCPMESHSYVVMEELGNCPVCGMEMEEI